MPLKAIKSQLTCPFEITFGSFLIGRRRILVIPRNHLEFSQLVDSFKIHNWPSNIPFTLFSLSEQAATYHGRNR